MNGANMTTRPRLPAGHASPEVQDDHLPDAARATGVSSEPASTLHLLAAAASLPRPLARPANGVSPTWLQENCTMRPAPVGDGTGLAARRRAQFSSGVPPAVTGVNLDNFAVSPAPALHIDHGMLSGQAASGVSIAVSRQAPGDPAPGPAAKRQRLPRHPSGTAVGNSSLPRTGVDASDAMTGSAMPDARALRQFAGSGSARPTEEAGQPSRLAPVAAQSMPAIPQQPLTRRAILLQTRRLQRPGYHRLSESAVIKYHAHLAAFDALDARVPPGMSAERRRLRAELSESLKKWIDRTTEPNDPSAGPSGVVIQDRKIAKPYYASRILEAFDSEAATLDLRRPARDECTHKLISIPKCVTDLKHVRTLRVSECRLDHFCSFPPELTALHISQSSVGKLQDLPESISEIHLDKVKIKTIDRLPAGLKTFRQVDCTISSLCPIPESVAR